MRACLARARGAAAARARTLCARRGQMAYGGASWPVISV
jgi:hypothetical protein